MTASSEKHVENIEGIVATTAATSTSLKTLFTRLIVNSSLTLIREHLISLQKRFQKSICGFKTKKTKVT